MTPKAKPTPEPTRQARNVPAMPPGVLAVTDAPIQRRINSGMYDAWFDTRCAGDCLEVAPDRLESVKGYLARYIKTKRMPWVQVSSKAQPDGVARIWIANKKT